MEIANFYHDEFTEHLKVAEATQLALKEPFGQLVQLSVETIRNNGALIFFGNGGSASDAQHLATELTVRYTKIRPAIAAMALTTDTSALTANRGFGSTGRSRHRDFDIGQKPKCPASPKNCQIFRD